MLAAAVAARDGAQLARALDALAPSGAAAAPAAASVAPARPNTNTNANTNTGSTSIGAAAGPWAAGLRQAAAAWAEAGKEEGGGEDAAFARRLRAAEALLDGFKAEDGEWLRPALLRAVVRAVEAARLEPAKLTRAKELMDACFRAAIASDAGSERKLTAMPILVLQFRVFFALGTPVMCRGLVAATRKPGFPEDDEFPAAARVAYWYQSARLAAMEDDPGTALGLLRAARAAMTWCPPAPAHARNAARVEDLLVVVSVALGLMPSRRVVQALEARRARVADLVRAVGRGDVRALLQGLDAHRAFFARRGAYFLGTGRCRSVAERQLVRAALGAHRAQAGDEAANKIPLTAFHEAFEAFGAPSPAPVARRVVSSLCHLIELGLVRGYVSVEKQMLVLSLKEPFPRTAVVMGGVDEGE